MAWYLAQTDIPGFAELSRRERRAAWREARVQLRKRGPYVTSMALHGACYSVPTGAAMWIATRRDLPAWSTVGLIAAAAAVAGLISYPLFLVRPTVPFLGEAIRQARARRERRDA